MTEHPHITEGDIECSCNPLVLTIAPDGSISRVGGGPLEEPIDTGVARSTPAEALDAVIAALTDEDEIAHGEAWDDVRKQGRGFCAYDDDDWPCRTQKGIDRLLARLTPKEPTDD